MEFKVVYGGGGRFAEGKQALTNALIGGVYSFHIYVPCPTDFS